MISSVAGGCPLNHSTPVPESTQMRTKCPIVGQNTQQQAGPVDPEAVTMAQEAQPRSGRCPVSHAGTAVRDRSSRSNCPVDHAALAAEATSGKCPVQHGSAQPPETPAAAAAGSAKPVCPFGYSSSDQPTLTELHCPRCRSLFWECAILRCGHRFCAACISPGGECLCCGASAGEPQPDAETQGRVEAFLARHSAEAAFPGATPLAAADSQDPEATRATLLLETGLRSLLGGNAGAAAARLAACRSLLLATRDSQGPSAELAARLGAVCGAQGDAELSRGAPEAAADAYREGIGHLEASEAAEARQALTVTLNKLGDLCYRRGNLAAAAQQYRRALQIRRAAAAAEPGPRAQLDCALSLAKVADIEQAMGGGAEAGALLSEARSLAADLEAEKQALDPPSAARLAALAAFLAGATQ